MNCKKSSILRIYNLDRHWNLQDDDDYDDSKMENPCEKPK